MDRERCLDLQSLVAQARSDIDSAVGSVNATQKELRCGEARLSPNEAIVVGGAKGGMGGAASVYLCMFLWGEEATGKKSLFLVYALSCLCLLRFRDPRPARDTVEGSKRCNSTQAPQANVIKVRDLSTVGLEGDVRVCRRRRKRDQNQPGC